MDLAECERNINDVKIINTTEISCAVIHLYYNTGI